MIFRIFIFIVLACFDVLGQIDDVNFKVVQASSVDQDLSDSVFYTLEDALKTPSRVRRLIIVNQGLKHIPYEVYRFRNLQVLDISHNTISSLPDSFFLKCNALKELRYAGNQLKRIPSAIYGSELRILDVSENLLTVLLDSISTCRFLEELDLHANDLNSLPNHKDVLEHLQSLILSGNPIERLTPWVFKQPHLKILFLDDTNVHTLDYALCDASQIRFMNIEGSKIRTLPPCFCQLKYLKVLQIGSSISDKEMESLAKCLPDLKIR